MDKPQDRKENKGWDSGKENPQRSGKEYFYFKCLCCGHENYLNLETNSDMYQKLPDEEVVVTCQQCRWQSPPFKPRLFQHTTGGDVLLWVYTSQESSSINSVFNISFSPQESNTFPSTALSAPSAPPEAAPQFDPEETVRIPSAVPIATPIDQPKTLRIPAMSRSSKRQQKIISENAQCIQHPSKADTKDKEIAATTEIPVAPPAAAAPPPEPKSEQLTASIGNTATATANPYQSYHYFPDGLPTIRIPAPPSSPLLVRTSLWIFTFCIFAFMGLQTCNEQGEKIAAAIRAIKITNSSAYLPSTSAQDTGKQQDTSRSWQNEYQELYKKYQKVQATLTQSTKAHKQLQDAHKALTVSYETGQKQQRELNGTLAQINTNYAQLQKNYQNRKHHYQEMVKALTEEFRIEQLNDQEQDFQQVSLSPDGRCFIFYREQPVERRKVRTSLQLALLTYKGMRRYELFITPPVKMKKQGVPFMYSWDGRKNVVVLSRIEGKNYLHHIRFQIGDGTVKISKPREILSAVYPDVIGAPTLSSHALYLAFLHLDKGELWVKVYNLEDGTFKARTFGGGDTSRVPVWGANNKNLYFLANDRQGIIQWNLLRPREKKVKKLAQEVYGRYLACSPKANHLAFFQRNSQGKGRVDLCIYNNATDQITVLAQNLLTVESARPTWSMEGRFLAIIHSGAQDQVVIYDTRTATSFPAFRKIGKILWVDWNYPGAIAFSYREGLFTRPYLVRFISWFARY